MKKQYRYIIVIAFLLNIFAYAMESESQWKKIDINTSIIPLNITCKKNGDLYLLGKANKTASPTIFKLDKDKNSWESMAKLDITTDIIDLFKGLKKSVEYIHAVQDTLFAIVKEQSNESIYKIMHEDIGLLKQWKQIYPPNNETEKRPLIRLSGQTLDQIWVTFKEHEIEKSFSLTKKIDNTFKKESEKNFFYRNVDTNNRSPEITMWALSSTKNKLITNTKYEAPRNIIYSFNAQLSPINIFVDDNENIYGIDKNQTIYKWDFDLKNFMALENSPNQIISLCTMPNNILYSLDTNAQLYTWQESGEQKAQRLKTNKDLFDIITQEEPAQSEFYETPKSSSSEDESLSEAVKEAPSKTVQEQQQQQKQPQEQQEQKEQIAQNSRPEDQSSYEVIKEKQQRGLSLSPTKHFLNQYIEKAHKEIPEKPKSLLSPEESRLRKFVISTVGLTAAASTAAYAKGYITFTDIIKYTFTTGFTLTTSLVIRDALRYTCYNWKLKKQQEEQNWHDNLIKLKETTELRGISIASQSYAVANEFEFKKPDHQDSYNYNFYLMPTDDYLVFTFQQIINKFKNNKNIKYIAVRPTPGITEDRAILGTKFPRIIISTNISDTPNAQKMLFTLKNITEGVLPNNRDIPNIGKQPSFSQKTLNKLIYWSLGSFDYHKNEYDMNSWLQRLQGLPKPEKSLDREYLPKPVSSDHE